MTMKKINHAVLVAASAGFLMQQGDNEMFWIVKHGMRNTAMPALGNLLSDDEIWHVVTLVRKFDSLPDSATLELLGHHP